MRDLVLFAVVLGAIPLILTRTWLGIMFWSWISYMSPHRLAWGPAFSFPFAQLIGAATLVSLVLSRERKYIEFNTTTVLWLVLIAWMCVTTAMAVDHSLAAPFLSRVLKIQLFAFLTLLVIHGRQRIEQLVWVIVVSIGFYGLKGGVFAFFSGGASRVWGPPDTYIADNNALAVALITILPLLRYCQLRIESHWAKWAIYGVMGSIALSILASHSRGAMLAASAMAAMMWWKSRHKVGLALALVAAIPMLLAFMPQAWYDRMSTLKTYEQDNSAMGRITAWEFAVDAANGRLTGVGFGGFIEQNYKTFSPEIAAAVQARDGRYQGAHSIYFQVLGEHGWVGLVLFLAIGFGAWRACSATRRLAKGKAELAWAADLAGMLQVSLLGFAIGGAFLNLAYYDLPYHIVGLSLLLRTCARESLLAAAPGQDRRPQPRGASATGAATAGAPSGAGAATPSSSGGGIPAATAALSDSSQAPNAVSFFRRPGKG